MATFATAAIEITVASGAWAGLLSGTANVNVRDGGLKGVFWQGCSLLWCVIRYEILNIKIYVKPTPDLQVDPAPDHFGWHESGLQWAKSVSHYWRYV